MVHDVGACTLELAAAMVRGTLRVVTNHVVIIIGGRAG